MLTSLYVKCQKLTFICYYMLLYGVFPKLRIHEKRKYCCLMAQNKLYLRENNPKHLSDTVLHHSYNYKKKQINKITSSLSSDRLLY